MLLLHIPGTQHRDYSNNKHINLNCILRGNTSGWVFRPSGPIVSQISARTPFPQSVLGYNLRLQSISQMEDSCNPCVCVLWLVAIMLWVSRKQCQLILCLMVHEFPSLVYILTWMSVERDLLRTLIGSANRVLQLYLKVLIPEPLLLGTLKGRTGMSSFSVAVTIWLTLKMFPKLVMGVGWGKESIK